MANGKVKYIVVREGQHIGAYYEDEHDHAIGHLEREKEWQQNEAHKWGVQPSRVWIETR